MHKSPGIRGANARVLVTALEAIHRAVRDQVRRSMIEQSVESLRSADDSSAGDTTYGIDRIGESALLRLIERHLADWLPVIVVAEGLPDLGLGPGVAVVPSDAAPDMARFRVIVDPIDGTRGLMYGKRSAWILTGVAVQGASVPTLCDIEVAVQTEIPPLKQALADTLRAVRGAGASATRTHLDTGETNPFRLSPSDATTIKHGFGQIMRCFPGGREVLAEIDDEICLALLGPGRAGKAATFEDQYISTGGQIAELVYGHDRWIADLRPLLKQLLADRGLAPPLCAHPYDICTALIAREAGVLVSAPDSGPLDVPLVLDADVAWVGYANAKIRSAVQPVLLAATRRRGLLP
jgi:fructose-1,6-bisphosphatase/inositol monophosphatase family enzyme